MKNIILIISAITISSNMVFASYTNYQQSYNIDSYGYNPYMNYNQGSIPYNNTQQMQPQEQNKIQKFNQKVTDTSETINNVLNSVRQISSFFEYR